MYKMMIFLNKTRDEESYENFIEFFVTPLEEIAGSKIPVAKIEGAAMAGEKYTHYCEINTDTRDEMDKLFATPEGRNFTKTIQNFLGRVTLFYSNFEV